jgi:hypothetical protein
MKWSDAKFIIADLVSETMWTKTSQKIWKISKLIHRVRQMFYLHIFSSQQATVISLDVIYWIFIAQKTAVAQWLRYCATNQKVAGSIPDGVNGIFH